MPRPSDPSSTRGQPPSGTPVDSAHHHCYVLPHALRTASHRIASHRTSYPFRPAARARAPNRTAKRRTRRVTATTHRRVHPRIHGCLPSSNCSYGVILGQSLTLRRNSCRSPAHQTRTCAVLHHPPPCPAPGSRAFWPQRPSWSRACPCRRPAGALHAFCIPSFPSPCRPPSPHPGPRSRNASPWGFASRSHHQRQPCIILPADAQGHLSSRPATNDNARVAAHAVADETCTSARRLRPPVRRPSTAARCATFADPFLSLLPPPPLACCVKHRPCATDQIPRSEANGQPSPSGASGRAARPIRPLSRAKRLPCCSPPPAQASTASTS